MDSFDNINMIGTIYSNFLKCKIDKNQIEEIELKVNNFVNFLIENSQNESKEKLKEKADNVINN